ncbi:MAG: DUF4097 family beta strand repeat protein [Treponema sp.]|nr:DUF4097 family beta strand repeat protein [Treponema sp.]
MKKTIIFITALLFAVFLFAEDTDLVSKRFYPSQVKSISTNFSAGKVTLKADNTEQISVIITGDKEASTPTVKVVNGVLTVKTGLLSSVKKKHNVTISVPYGISFDEIKILNFSANAEVQNINAASLTITTSSGKINISDSVFKKFIQIAGASGKINLSNIQSENVTLSAVGGQLEVNKCQSSTFRLEAMSGELNCSKINTESFNLQCTSGKISLSLDNMISEDSFIKTGSGKVILSLPENNGYTALVNSTSGKFTDEFTGTTVSMGHDIKSVYKDGYSTIKLDSVSGDITISKQQ